MINFLELFQKAPMSNVTKVEFEAYQTVLFRKLEAIEHNIIGLGALLEESMDKKERDDKEKQLERTRVTPILTDIYKSPKDDEDDDEDDEEEERKQGFDWTRLIGSVAGAVTTAIAILFDPSNQNSPFNFVHRLFSGGGDANAGENREEKTPEQSSPSAPTAAPAPPVPASPAPESSDSGEVEQLTPDAPTPAPPPPPAPRSPPPPPAPRSGKSSGGAPVRTPKPSPSGGKKSAGSGSPMRIGGSGLGSLSAEFESGKQGSSAIGWDKKGGTSYGKYQIAALTGTFQDFLEYLDSKGEEEMVKRLSSGPADTGEPEKGRMFRPGTVPTEWRKLIKEGKLQKYEHEFIKKTHFDKALDFIKEKNPELAKLIESSKVLQEVLWSTSVQHGPGLRRKKGIGAAGIFLESYAPNMSQEEFIQSIYQKRSKMFSGSTEATRASVGRRFEKEQTMAISALSSSPSPASLAPASSSSAPAAALSSSAPAASSKKPNVTVIDASKNTKNKVVTPPAQPPRTRAQRPPSPVRNPVACPSTGECGKT